MTHSRQEERKSDGGDSLDGYQEICIRREESNKNPQPRATDKDNKVKSGYYIDMTRPAVIDVTAQQQEMLKKLRKSGAKVRSSDGSKEKSSSYIEMANL